MRKTQEAVAAVMAVGTILSPIGAGKEPSSVDIRQLGTHWNTDSGDFEFDPNLYDMSNLPNEPLRYNATIPTAIGDVAVVGFGIYAPESLEVLDNRKEIALAYVETKTAEIEAGSLLVPIIPPSFPMGAWSRVRRLLPSSYAQLNPKETSGAAAYEAPRDYQDREMIGRVTEAYNNDSLIIRSYSFDGEFLGEERHHIDLPERELCGDSEPSVEVVSDTELDNESVERFCKVSRLFQSFMPEEKFQFTVNQMADILYDRDYYASSTDRIGASVPVERDIDGIELGMVTLVHEATHKLYNDIKTKDPERLKPIQGAYWQVMETMKHSMPTKQQRWLGYEMDKNEPVWAAMTESTYIDRLSDAQSEIGHPWDNDNEMTASISAVMRFFPKEFVNEIAHTLTPRQRSVVSSVGLAVIDLLRDQSPEGLDALVPQHEEIRQALEGYQKDTTEFNYEDVAILPERRRR